LSATKIHFFSIKQVDRASSFFSAMKKLSQKFHGNICTSLRIGQGVMVVREVIAAGCGDGLELVVGE
jgi:hypothetical protein